MERVLVFVISDDEVSAGCLGCGESCQIILFDHKYVAKVKEAQFVVEWIWIGVHSSVSDRSLCIWTMIVLALICVLGFLMEIKVIIQEISVHQDGGDYGRTIVAQ